MVGIYKITSPTNAVYIGQSFNINKIPGTNISKTLRGIYSQAGGFKWEYAQEGQEG